MPSRRLLYRRPRKPRSLLSRLYKPLYVALLVTLCLLFFAPIGVKACGGDDQKPQDAIGIDLGTTYSVVGIMERGQVKIIPLQNGRTTVPSWVSFDEHGRIVGDAAKLNFPNNPSNTIFDVKRLMGKAFLDPDVQQDLKTFPFNVTSGPDGRAMVQVKTLDGVKAYAPEEISAAILSNLKSNAERHLGHPVTQAVITVPAYFNDAQRTATRVAGEIAGLEVLRVINEPTAAAVAHRVDKPGESNVLVYDLGGGTFDVSVLSNDDGVFEVLAVSGDPHLGGEDFDNRVIDHVSALYQDVTGVPMSSDLRVQLKPMVEAAKKSLSEEDSTTINLDGHSFHLTRETFDRVNKDLFEKTLSPIRRALKDARLKPSDIDDVVLIGGSTRIPAIRKLVTDFFGNKPLATGIDPDEAVARGAAIQAAILSGYNDETAEVLVMDIIPMTLGIETTGGIFAGVVTRNSPVPTRRTRMFSTEYDDQTRVTIKVFEGERGVAKENHFLGTFDLDGIPPQPRGTPQIEVTFTIDVNGILHVSAVEKSSGTSNQVQIIQEARQLSQADIDRMVQEAEDYAREDERRGVIVDEMRDSLAAARLIAHPKQAAFIQDADSFISQQSSFVPLEELETKALELRKSLSSPVESAHDEL